MKSLAKEEVPHFGKAQFFKASLPAYFAPLLSAGLPAYFLGKEELLHDSYSTIALPSLIATIICFLLLAQFQQRQVLLFNRLTMTVILGIVMVILSLFVIWGFGLQSKALTICSSAIIGVVIISLRTPLKKVDK